MATVEVKVPDIGDFKEVQVIEVLVKVGDSIKVDQSLLTVESDKASMEIPSGMAGTVRELRVKVGDKVGEGSVVLTVDSDAASGDEPAAPAPSASAAPAEAAAPAAAPAESGSRTLELVVPDIGDTGEVAVIEVFIKAGDTLKAEQSVITVESDKASMEIPSSHSGVVKELRVKLGDKVRQGTVLATLEAVGASAPAAVAAAPAAGPAQAGATSHEPATPDTPEAPSTPVTERVVPTAALPEPEIDAPVGHLPHASPSIRRLARELGVPLAEVNGSGPKGRIVQADVQSFVKGVMAGEVRTAAQGARGAAAVAPAAGGLPGLLPWPQVDFAKFGPVERRDLSRIRKIAAANLHRNWVMIPHVTNHDDADITELESLRVQLNKEHEKAGIKVTMLAFLIKAVVATLKKFPEFNASLDGEQLVLKQYFHIGFAADTPNGLVVPVLRDADQKGVLQIAQEMNALAAKARDGKLSPADMAGGCFSISSLGGIGGRYFTPIINAPEVAILGVCRSVTQPVWDGQAFQPRLVLPLSLSWDHRVVDGASAARFNAHLVQVLGDFRRVLL